MPIILPQYQLRVSLSLASDDQYLELLLSFAKQHKIIQLSIVAHGESKYIDNWQVQKHTLYL